MSTRTEVVTPALLREWHLPQPGGSKHSRGHVVIIGGSRSTPGALALAGVSALRVGAGVLAFAAPEPVAVALAISVPESSVRSFDDSGQGDAGEGDAGREGACWNDRLTDLVSDADAILLGPGLDSPSVTAALLRALADIELGGTSVVLDAFALGVLARDPTLFPGGCATVVLSPNVSEAARLLDVAEDDLDGDALSVARQLARRWSAIVTYRSSIADPDGRSWEVPVGHAGLGTSGSGDVLAGALAGLLARGADGSQAAVWGTYLHAAAGDRLAPKVGRLGFLARELLDELPSVLTEIQA